MLDTDNCHLSIGEAPVKVLHEGDCVSEDIRAPCPKCDTTYAPVCGDDGQTYDNDCLLATQNCNKPTFDLVKKVHDGNCQPTVDICVRTFCSELVLKSGTVYYYIQSCAYHLDTVLVRHFC